VRRSFATAPAVDKLVTMLLEARRSGVPVHVVSERAGDANPAIMLSVYAHLFPGQLEGAAATFRRHAADRSPG
jgi:hypothetical protein